ncbi:MAG: CRISPR system precrRNA processing endoribonuclease RAMP protein Cas6 [Elusimicrobia bacterium]|nr:CRISPR system precrRNA processing endoribonuclease RAMP protein Cas6 [Elusimicrobiota bacterium]
MRIDFLPMAKYTITAEALEDIQFPFYKGATIRGGFGYALKRISCVQRRAICESCILRDNCVYFLLFEKNADSGLKEIPRPFVIEPPQCPRKKIPTGESFSFNLILFGNLIRYFPNMLYAFIKLGERGFGNTRGRYRIKNITNLIGEVVYENGRLKREENTGRIEVPEIRGDFLQLTFLTPTRIKYKAHYTDSPEFYIIVKTLLRRLKLLTRFYTEEKFDVDSGKLTEMSKKVRIVQKNIRWFDWDRYSSRQKVRMKLGGFIGDVLYEGDFESFLPYLFLGEYTHIGKNCTFGLGKYKIVKH